MRHFLFILLLIGGVFSLCGQEYNWDNVLGAFSTGFVEGNDIAVCSNNNYYLTGTFTGDVVFGDETHPGALKEYPHTFYVAKIDPDENQWSWSKTPVTPIDSYGISRGGAITVDNDDNIIVGGSFWGEMNLGDVYLTSVSYGDSVDSFIAKIDPDGVWLWATRGGGDNDYNSAIRGVVTDETNNIYIVGFSGPNATFGDFFIPGYGNVAILVGKLDQNGNWLWVESAGGSSVYDNGLDIALDSNNDILITGRAFGNTTFGPFQIDNEGSYAYVAKLTSEGEWLWVNYTEEAFIGDHMYRNSGAEGISLAVNSSNDIFLTGRFYGAVSFGSLTLLQPPPYDYFNLPDQFLAAVNSQGEWLWAQSFDNSTYGFSYHLDGGVVRVDNNDVILVSGGFCREITLGDSTLVSQGEKDFFVAEFDSAGELLWYDHVYGGFNNLNRGIAFDANNNAILTGSFSETISFGEIGLESDGTHTSAYCARLNRGQDLGIESNTEPMSQRIFNYPNPFNPHTAISFFLSYPSRVQLDVYNTKGQLVKSLYDGDLLSGEHEIQWDGRDIAGRNLPSGIYFYQLSTHKERITEKMMLLK